MPRIRFYNQAYGNGRVGFAVVNPKNQQLDGIHHCKEVFSHRLVGWRNREALEISARGTVKFLHKDVVRLTPEWAKHKVNILHTFEKAMGFTPLAKCQIVMDGNKSYLFYEVSASWAKSHPLAHILAVLIRSPYPEHGVVEWPEIVAWLRAHRKWNGADAAVYEIIAAKGEIRSDIPEVNGIVDYARERNERVGQWR